MATAEDKKDDLTTCSICFETFRTPKYFPCLHSFCEGCIQTYITKTFAQTQEGVHCPLCRMFVTKPDDVNVDEWSTKLPTNHILVSLIDLNETKSGQKLCAACSRENETESAFSWCANCCEALCKSCDRYHRRSKASSNHKLIDLCEEATPTIDLPLHQADIFCTEHPEKKVEAYCNDHSAICCVTCIMLKHRKCDNVGSIEEAAEEKKKLKEIKEFSKDLERIKTSLVKLCENRTENLYVLDNDIKKIRTDVEALFIQLTDHLKKLNEGIISEIMKVEKEIKPEIENERDELKCRIPAIDNDLSLFQTNMKHAPPAQFIQAMEKLALQKEILENFVKDQSESLKEIRVTFRANEKLQVMNKVINEFGKISVHRAVRNEVHLTDFSKKCMHTAVPTLTSKVDTGFQVRGIALLDNGQIALSNYDNSTIELRDIQCSSILSTLSLPGTPWGIKMTSDTEGAVAVAGHGLIIFKIQNNQIVKVKELQIEVNSDFVYHKSLYYLGYNEKITVYDSQYRKCNDIPVKHNVSYMAICNDKFLLYTTFNNASRAQYLYCVHIDGTQVFTYSHEELRDVSGVTVDHSGYIYVCGHDYRTVHQLNHDGKLQRIIFDCIPGFPLSISFNRQCNKAVIGCDEGVLLYGLN